MPTTQGQLTLQDSYQFISDRITSEDGSFPDEVKERIINDTLRRMRRKFDVPSSEQTSQTNLYSLEYYYNPPSPYLKQISRMYANYSTPDYSDFNPVSDDVFWRDARSSNLVSFTNEGANNYLLANVQTPYLPVALVNPCDTLNSYGTWALVAGNDADNLSLGTLYYRNGSASIQFDIDVSQSVNDYAEIICTGMPFVNLSENTFQGISTFFLWLYLPDSTDFTSFTMQIGSSLADYYEITTTVPFAGSTWKPGWNRVAWSWRNATTVGSPNSAQLDFFRFRATYPNTMTDQTGLCVDLIQAKTPRLYNLHWMSSALIADGATNAPKLSFDSPLDTSSYYIMDEMWVDYIHYSVLEECFTNFITDQDARDFYKGLRIEVEDTLQERFPSPRQPQVGEWQQTDEIQLLLN